MAMVDYLHLEGEGNKEIREKLPLYLKKWKRKIQKDTGCNPFCHLQWWDWYKFFYLKDEICWWLIRNCDIEWLSIKIQDCYPDDYKFPYKVIYSKKSNPRKTNRYLIQNDYYGKYYMKSCSYKEYLSYL